MVSKKYKTGKKYKSQTIKKCKRLLFKLKKLKKKHRKFSEKKLKKNNRKRLTYKIRKNKVKGGFGSGANPFIGCPWNVNKDGYYYKHSPTGIDVGGISPYAGDNSPAPQISGGGYIPQPINMISDQTMTFLNNISNSIKGRNKFKSPLPFVDQFKKPTQLLN